MGAVVKSSAHPGRVQGRPPGNNGLDRTGSLSIWNALINWHIAGYCAFPINEVFATMGNKSIHMLLVESAIASAMVTAEQMELDGKKVGAYSLAVQAAAECGDAVVLSGEYDKLFAEIRTSGSVVNGKKKVALGCKANKEGTGFLIPSAISSARSYMTDALTSKIPLVSAKGELRSFSEIRRDVQKVKADDKRATAKGDDLARIECADFLAVISEKVKTAKGADLAMIRDTLATIGAKVEKTAPRQSAGAAMAQAA